MLLFTNAFSHSYLSCSNYDLKNSKCCGFARNFDKGYLKTQRLGYKYKSETPNALDIDPMQTSTTYPAAHPMAQVAPGGSLVLTWPPNNHAFGKGEDGSSSTLKQAFIYDTKKTKLATLDFTNCKGIGEKFSKEQNQSQCSGEWKVNLPVGQHSLIWAWQQNKNEAYYTTAFDITVTNTPSNPTCEAADIVPKAPVAALGSGATSPSGMPAAGQSSGIPYATAAAPSPNAYSSTPAKKCYK